MDRRNNRRDETVLGPIQVDVVDNNINRAMNSLKREIGREGVNRELKRRRFYEKPSVAKRRKTEEAERQRRKDARRNSTARSF
jgi:small subunit ribosomal protein S21